MSRCRLCGERRDKRVCTECARGGAVRLCRIAATGCSPDEQKGLLATGIIKAEGNMTSGDATAQFPLLLEKGLDGPREKVADVARASI
ncbi:hypothetical protein ACLK1S_05050 [Escherichia coli]